MALRFPTPRSPPTSGRRSTPRTSTRSRFSAAATPPTWATAPTAYSTSCRATDSSATARPNCSSPPAIFMRAKRSSPSATTPVETAWYASVTGSRSNYGLATPVPEIHHDATNSDSGFLSLIRNQAPSDQFRLDCAVPAGLLPDSLRSQSATTGSRPASITSPSACATRRRSGTRS